MTPSPCTEELQKILEHELSEYFGAPSKIIRLRRRPSEYRTSFALEVLVIDLDDGKRLDLIFKNLGWHALLDSARQVKPKFLHNPLREIEVYRTILRGARVETATCFGAFVDEQREAFWLFLEKVSGHELYQIGEFEKWQAVARWLAKFHDQFAMQIDYLKRHASLLQYDAAFYRLWPQRALSFTKDNDTLQQRNAHKTLAWLAARYEKVIEQLTSLPVTLIHGEFYSSNVLIQDEINGVRVCPVDWEMAGLGPGLIDLAALTAGKWSEEQKHALALAYHEASNDNCFATWENFLFALDCCRLHLAMQWLGWAPEWKPPTENAHDWLGEALNLAEKLTL